MLQIIKSEDLNVMLKEAMLTNDKTKIETIRSIIGVVKNAEKNAPGKTVNYTELISGLAKQRRQSIDEFTKGDRQDLADAEAKELAILEVFLPKQMDADRLKQIVADVCADMEAVYIKDMGKVVVHIKTLYGAQCDMAMASRFIKEKLS